MIQPTSHLPKSGPRPREGPLLERFAALMDEVLEQGGACLRATLAALLFFLYETPQVRGVGGPGAGNGLAEATAAAPPGVREIEWRALTLERIFCSPLRRLFGAGALLYILGGQRSLEGEEGEEDVTLLLVGGRRVKKNPGAAGPFGVALGLEYSAWYEAAPRPGSGYGPARMGSELLRRELRWTVCRTTVVQAGPGGPGPYGAGVGSFASETTYHPCVSSALMEFFSDRFPQGEGQAQGEDESP